MHSSSGKALLTRQEPGPWQHPALEGRGPVVGPRAGWPGQPRMGVREMWGLASAPQPAFVFTRTGREFSWTGAAFGEVEVKHVLNLPTRGRPLPPEALSPPWGRLPCCGAAPGTCRSVALKAACGVARKPFLRRCGRRSVLGGFPHAWSRGPHR